MQEVYLTIAKNVVVAIIEGANPLIISLAIDWALKTWCEGARRLESRIVLLFGAEKSPCNCYAFKLIERISPLHGVTLKR